MLVMYYFIKNIHTDEVQQLSPTNVWLGDIGDRIDPDHVIVDYAEEYLDPCSEY